jgi:hypothetical protein
MPDTSSYNFSKAEIENANDLTKSCRQAAEYLGCSYNTYKKYAKMYGLFEEQKNQAGKGIPNPHNLHEGKDALDDIVDGEKPGYDSVKLKKRLLRSGYKKEECEICGFDERRVTDKKVPLVLMHENGDRRDHRWENLKIVCPNCAFLHFGEVPLRKGMYDY